MTDKQNKIAWDGEMYIREKKIKEAIPKIINMFCVISPKPYDSVYGMDTELFEHEEEAIKAVEEKLGL